MALVLAALVLTVSPLVGCDGTDASPASDAGLADAPDAAVADAPGDAIADAEAEAAATCDIGVVPTMPALTSEVVIEGGEGGAAPAATGGDETGLWLYTKISLYLPAQASGQIEPAESKIDGKGFIELDGGRFRQLVDTTTVLSTSVVGKVTRAGSTKASGTYAKSGATATLTVACRESTGETGTLGDVGFSRVDATHGKLHVKTTSQIGTANLVIDLEKAP